MSHEKEQRKGTPRPYPAYMSMGCSRCPATADGETVHNAEEVKALREKWKRQGWSINRRVRRGGNLLCPECSAADLPDYII